MAYSVSLCARNLLISYGSRFGSFTKLGRRSIMSSSVFNAAEAVDELKRNPYFDKYAGKIAKLQKSSPEEFLSRLEGNVKKKNVKKETNSNKFEAKASSSRADYTQPKSLNEVMKLDLVKDKNKEEISEIWTEYHKNKDAVCAAIPADVYNIITSRSGRFPTFLLPLPRNEGYEFIVLQWSKDEAHFTPLISFQAHRENAAECLTVTYYRELIEDKKVVLMRGLFDTQSLNATEAQCLVNQLHLYYAEDHLQRTGLLEQFTDRPDSFKHMNLVAQLETVHIK